MTNHFELAKSRDLAGLKFQLENPKYFDYSVLHRISKAADLTWIISDMSCKLDDFKGKYPGREDDIQLMEKKLELMIDFQNYMYRLWEHGYINMKRNSDLQMECLILMRENEKLKEENEKLKRVINDV